MKTFFTWIDKLNQRFWARVVSSTALDVRSLSAFRIVIGVFLLTIKFTTFGWIADAPQALFYPPIFSVANLFDGFPGETVFFLLDCVLLLSLTCFTLGIKARLSTMIYLVSFVVGLSFNYSFGKIDHSTTLLCVVLACMSFSGWGSHLAILPDKITKVDSPAKSLSLLSVVLCFAMFTAGFPKLLNWIDFDTTTNGFLSWYRIGFYSLGKQYFLAPYVQHLPALVFELFDYAAVLLELTPLLFLLYSRKAWRVWLLLVCLFHLANSLLLNIPFTQNSLVYLVFIDFSWLYRKIRANLPLVKYSVVAFVLLFASTRLVLIFTQSQLLNAVSPETEMQLTLYLDVAVWVVSIAFIANSILSGDHTPAKGRFVKNSALKA